MKMLEALPRAPLPLVPCPWAMAKPAFVGFGMAFSHPHLRSENDEISSLARRYNIHSTSVGITKAMGKDYAESGHCCSMYCTYERGRIRLN